MGHPYSKANPEPIGADQINAETGKFRDSFVAVKNGFGDSQINNTSPIADYLLQGTKKMIARPIGQAIEEMLGPVRMRLLTEAVDSAFH